MGSPKSLAGLDWKPAVIPGIYFLTVEPELAVYGKVLRLQADGYLWVFCYNHLCGDGEEAKLHNSELTTPLSIEQFKTARRLGWPSHQDGLIQILTLPSN